MSTEWRRRSCVPVGCPPLLSPAPAPGPWARASGGADARSGVVGGVSALLGRRSADGVILRIAERQHGAVTRAQLLALGVTRHEIATRLADGRLREVYRGVYLVGAIAPLYAREQAALFACGEGGVLSHATAGVIWQILTRTELPSDPHVTIPRARRTRRDGITLHRAPLARPDVRVRHGLRLTSPARTILDLAAVVRDAYELEAMVAEANFLNLASERELESQVERNPRRIGVRLLRDVLELAEGPQRTRSGGERKLLQLLRKRGITGFQTNSKIYGWEIDFLWRDLNFGVELDGWDGHRGRVAFERDRLKMAKLEARGITLMPVTGRQLRDDENGVLARIEAATRERRALRNRSVDTLTA